MKVDTRTLVLVRRRLAALPVLLHHETRTPAARLARIARIRRWMGYGWWVAGDYVPKGERLPDAGKGKWSRCV